MLFSGGFSVGWAKAGIAILRDPDQKGMVWTLYPIAFHTLKGFGLGPLIAEIWAFFQILNNFKFFILGLKIAIESLFFIRILSNSSIMCKSILEKYFFFKHPKKCRTIF